MTGRRTEPSWAPWALGGVLAVACFGALWRLERADWKVDESLDGAFAWEAVRNGNWGLEDGHPVFVRWFLGVGQLVLGQGRWGIRIAPALASVVAVALLYVVGRALGGWRTGLIAAAIWATVPRALVLGDTVVGPVRGDRFGYLEPFMVVALLAATLTGWRWAKGGAWSLAVSTGVLIGVGMAYKPTALVVLVPIALTGFARGRPVREVAGQVAAMGALGFGVLAVTYLPVGTDAPGHLVELFRYQIDHARTGHLLVVDGELTRSQPRWSHLWYQWRGMGPAVGLGLLIGIGGAWLDRGRMATRYVAGIWFTLLAYHLLSPVALPHYYLLWAPFSVLLAALGLDRLLAEADRPAVRAVGRAGVALLAVGALAGLWQVATLEHGDYGRMAAALRERQVTVTAVRYQGEAVDRYFPGTYAGQIGFTDPDAAFDVLVLDPRDTPMLGAGSADQERARARAAGLTRHQIGRLEVWYREP